MFAVGSWDMINLISIYLQLRLQDVDISVRPNAMRSVGKAILKSINDFVAKPPYLETDVRHIIIARLLSLFFLPYLLSTGVYKN